LPSALVGSDFEEALGELAQPEVLFRPLGDAHSAASLGLPRPHPWPPGRGPPLNEDHDWLRKWLATLEVHIPNASQVKAGFNVSISNGVCRHFEIDDVHSSITADPGFNLGVDGLHVYCELHWQAFPTWLPSLGSEGNVVAEVSNSSAGGPIQVVADDGSPPLPKAIKTYDCAADIRVKSLTFSGSVLSGILEIMSGFVKAILNVALKKVVCSKVDGLIETQGSEFLANASRAVRRFLAAPSVSPDHPWPLPKPESDFASLAANSGVQALGMLINGALGNASSPFNLKVLTSLILGQHGQFSADVLGLLPFSHMFSIVGYGDLNITLSAFALEGLNSWSELSLKQPNEREVGLGLGMDAVKVHLTLKLEVAPSKEGPLKGQTLTETFNMSAGVSGLAAAGSAFLAVNGSRLGAFAIDQLPQMGCLSLATEELLLTKADIHAAALTSGLTPDGSATLEQHLDELINRVAGVLLKEFGGAIGAVSNHLLNAKLRDMLNSKIEQELTFAPKCPAPLPTYALPGMSYFARFSAAVLVSMAVLVVIVTSIVRRRAKHSLQRTLTPCLSTLSSEQASPEHSFLSTNAPEPAPPAGVTRTVRLLVPADHEHRHRPDGWDCLAFHPRTAPSFRWALPLLVFANATMFIASNTVPGTNIMFALKANGVDVASFPPVKQYTLVSSVKEMIDSQVWALAILIVVFSGCWPYLKLLMMLACWFLPTRILSVARRQKVLDFLDAYGKWSLVDMFIMVIMMVAFKFNLSDSNLPLPLISDLFKSVGASFAFDVFADPTLSFHLFILATFSSLVLGHLMTGCHRYAHQLCEYGVTRDDAGARSRLCNKLRPGGYVEGKLFVYGPAVSLSVAGVLVLVGILLETFNFTFEGLSGLLLGEDGRVRPYSVVTLAMEIPQSNPEPNSVGMRWIQVSFIMFTMVFALAYPVLLTVLWCAPLPDKVQRRLLVSCQIMNAWNSLDVFVVSILASVMEIERFALAILGHNCDPINNLLSRSPALVEKMHGHPVCFDVITVLRSGYWLLFCAAIIEYFAGNAVLMRCSKAFCTSEGSSNQRVPATTAELAAAEGEAAA